jgi:lipoyl(octanoyl) transferase
MVRLDWTFLGRLAYRTALRLQTSHARRVAAGAGPVLFFVEHSPTITLGRRADPSHIKLGAEDLARRGIEVHRVNRGGDVTFHGPGQLVGYPVASLDSASCSVPQWVGGHAGAVVRFLGGYGIHAKWSEATPGIWVGRQKIAALGFHISRRVSTHGFALNMDTDLSYFDAIVPCGLRDRGVTSMRALGARIPPMREAAARIAGLVAETLGWIPGTALDADRVLNAMEDCFEIGMAG